MHELFWSLRPSHLCKIAWSTDDRPRDLRGESNGNHVLLDRLAQADASIVACRNKVDSCVIQRNFQDDVRVSSAKHGYEDAEKVGRASWRRYPQGAHRSVAEAGKSRERLGDLSSGRSQAHENCMACFRERYSTRRSLEQCDAMSCFEQPNRLADRGGRYAESPRSRSKAAGFGDSQECGHPVEWIGNHLHIMNWKFITFVPQRDLSHQFASLRFGSLTSG